MNLYELKNDSSYIVKLLPNKATNKYGNVLRWIIHPNGNKGEIWEDRLNADFRPCKD